MDESVEAGLLLQDVAACRAGGLLLEGQVHALVAPVLLGAARLDALGFYSPSRQCYTYPSITTFHNILATLPPETLETALANWARQQSGHPGEVAQNE